MSTKVETVKEKTGNFELHSNKYTFSIAYLFTYRSKGRSMNIHTKTQWSKYKHKGQKKTLQTVSKNMEDVGREGNVFGERHKGTPTEHLPSTSPLEDLK